MIERPDAAHALFAMEKLNGEQLKALREYILKLEKEFERAKNN